MASPDRFDGLEVDLHQARFSGTVELDPTDADRMSMDTTFVAVVVCTVGGANITDNAKGEVVRTNKFKLDRFAVVRTSELQDSLYDALPALSGEAPDPEMFQGTDDGRVVIEPTLDPVPAEDVADEEDLDDEEIFSPGVSRPQVSRAPSGVPSGIPVPGSQPRQYDDALAGFLNERVQ